MYTLDIKYYKKQTLIYFISSIFCLIFGRIYDIFSHDVHSKFMLNAYLIPLIFGCILSFIVYIFKLNKLFKRISINLYNASVATITIYFIFYGVLEIYGTTNKLINVYLYVSILLLIISIIINLMEVKNV